MILVVIIMTVIVFENTVTVDVTGIFKVTSVNIVITQLACLEDPSQRAVQMQHQDCCTHHS